MRSSRQIPRTGLRAWLSPLIALALSLGLALLPPGAKQGMAGFLERSLFYPFRFAVGWGPRSLIAEQRANRLIREQGERRWRMDETLEVRAENARLRRLLGFERRSGFTLVPATVVGRGRGHLGEMLVVEPSDPAAVVPGEAALTPDGLIGRVLGMEGRYARIECLNHLEVAVSVLDSRSREGGILKWNPAGGLAIEAIPGQTDWQVGDRLVTSGLGLAFPRGILVGWVMGERVQRGGLLKAILVRPAASSARAEEVFLLRAEPGLEPRASAPEPASPGTPAVADASSLFPVDPAVRTGRALAPGGVGGGAAPEPVP